MFKMPEPICYRVHWPLIGGGFKWQLTDKPLLEKEGFKNEPLHSEAQLKQAVRDALDLAAQVAGPEDSYQDEHFKAKADSAARIRKLKEGL